MAKKNSFIPLFLIVLFLSTILCACGERPDPGEATNEEAPGGEPSGKETTPAATSDSQGVKPPSQQSSPSHASEVMSATGLRFIYDKFSGDQVYLNAYVEGMSETGGKVTLIKRVGPMNYTGHKMEGELEFSGEQAARLREILTGYDLEAWSQLPTGGSGASPSRSLIVFRGDVILYNVMWNARFPETLPPQEDILYFELFNFFNDLVAAEPGWEEVVSDNLEDPRDNPAYYERTVTWFGNEVKLVPGTGTYYEDGRYAEIDYEGRDWWIEEGFTGKWELDVDEPTLGGLNIPESAALTVYEDGTLEFVLDGEVWQGEVYGKRKYMDDFWITLEKEDGQWRGCEVSTLGRESYDRIHISYNSNPYPEPQYPPIDIYLVKTE